VTMTKGDVTKTLFLKPANFSEAYTSLQLDSMFEGLKLYETTFTQEKQEELENLKKA